MLYILGHVILEWYQALGDSLFFISQLVKKFYFLNHTFPDICQRILGVGRGLFIKFFYILMRGCLNLKMIREVLSIWGQLYYLLEFLHVKRKVCLFGIHRIRQDPLVASTRNQIKHAYALKRGNLLSRNREVSWTVANIRTRS